VLLELADAEQFGAQRLFVRRPNRVLAIGPRGPPNNAFERVHGGP
jgi:hypothetical protein